jgi:hypothetical protein
MGNLKNATKLGDIETENAYNLYFVWILEKHHSHKIYWMSISLSYYTIITVCLFEDPSGFTADGQSKTVVLCHLMILTSKAYHTFNRTRHSSQPCCSTGKRRHKQFTGLEHKTIHQYMICMFNY